MTDEELEASYGPLVPQTEFQRGERISYRDDNGVTKNGTILWVRAVEMVVERVKGHRLEYVVDTGTGSPALVSAEQLLREQGRQTMSEQEELQHHYDAFRRLSTRMLVIQTQYPDTVRALLDGYNLINADRFEEHQKGYLHAHYPFEEISLSLWFWLHAAKTCGLIEGWIQ